MSNAHYFLEQTVVTFHLLKTPVCTVQEYTVALDHGGVDAYLLNAPVPFITITTEGDHDTGMFGIAIDGDVVFGDSNRELRCVIDSY